MPTRERQVVLVAFDGMQLLDIVGPADMFHAASLALAGPSGYAA